MQRLVDFAELLLRAYRAVPRQREIQAHYRRACVTSWWTSSRTPTRCSTQWLRVLAGDTGKLFVVAMTIRHSTRPRRQDREHRQVPARLPRREIIRLERTPVHQQILNAANGLIARNTGRLRQEPLDRSREGDKLQFTRVQRVRRAEFVLARIEDFRTPRLDSAQQRSCIAPTRSRACSRILIPRRIP